MNVPEEQAAAIDKVFQIRGKTAIPLFTFGALLCFISSYVSIVLFLIITLAFLLGYDQKLSQMLKNRSAGS